MKKLMMIIFLIISITVISGCNLIKRNTLNDDISKIVNSKINVAELVPTTLKFSNSQLNQNTTNTYHPLFLSTSHVYTKDELPAIQSEGFKIISDNVTQIQNHLNDVYQYIDNNLGKNNPLGKIINKNHVSFILNKTDTGYSFYLNSNNSSTPIYLEININNQDSNNLIITARYELKDVYTAYIKFSNNYIKEAYLLNNVMFSIGEYSKDSSGNTTIKNFRKNLITNRKFYLTAYGNDTYGGITRHQYDDLFKTDSLYTEIYNSNAELIFQSYKYNLSLSNLGTEGARWFLKNVDGWNTITDNQGTNHYNHNWTILGDDKSTYTINNTLTDNILTRGYNISYEPFTRVVISNQSLSLKQTKALVLIILGNSQNADALFTLPQPFSSDIVTTVKSQTKNLDTIYNTEDLWGLPFKTFTSDQGMTLIPPRNVKAYPDANTSTTTTSTTTNNTSSL